MSKKCPVWSLKPGMSFIGDDTRTWTVDEVIPPPPMSSHIGETPKAYTLVCHNGQTTRKWAHQGAKLVVLVEKGIGDGSPSQS